MIIALLLAQWLQIIDTTLVSPSFSDPSGITIANGNLLVVDSEVGETTMWDRPTLFAMTKKGAVRSTASLQRLTQEATGIAYDEKTGTLFISEDNRGGWLHTIRRAHTGRNAKFGMGNDVYTSFSLKDVGIETTDIEGVTFFDGRLYLAGGGSREVYVLDVGDLRRRKQFQLLETRSMAPMRSVEGVTTDGTLLYAVGSWRSYVYAFDLVTGAFVGGQRLPKPRRSPSGIAIDTETGLFYITDRGVDNDQDPDENDGRIYVIKSEFSK